MVIESFFNNTRKIMGLIIILSLVSLIVYFDRTGEIEIVKTLVVSFVGAVGLMIGFFFDKD